MNANSIQIQAIVTFLMPALIQLLKRSRAKGLQWIDQDKPKICVLTSAATALATSMGIEFAHASHSLTISWGDSGQILHGFLTFIVLTIIQIGGQHALYGGFWKQIFPTPSPSAPIQDSKLKIQDGSPMYVGGEK